MGKEEPEKPDEGEPPEDNDHLDPVEEKIPEPPDNLRKREDWFRKRTGG